MSKRQPRVNSGPSETEWRNKVHPFFVKSAEFNKTVRILVTSSSEADNKEGTRLNVEVLPDLEREAEILHDELVAQGRIRHRKSLAVYGAEHRPPGSVISQGDYMFHWLCFFRYGKTAEQLLQEYDAGKIKAVKQLHSLSLEYDKWRYGQLDPNKLKFKIDVDHFDLITAGLDLGLEDLTPKELADCFDALCPCNKPHFPENLSKLRVRILRAFPPIPLVK